MRSNTDQIRENAASVDLLERRLDTVESWLEGLKNGLVEADPEADEETTVDPEPVISDADSGTDGKLIVFEGDGFRVKCQPFPGELIADDQNSQKGNFVATNGVFVSNGEPKTYSYEYTVQNLSSTGELTVTADRKKFKVAKLSCSDLSFQLMQGKEAKVDKPARYQRISRTLVEDQ